MHDEMKLVINRSLDLAVIVTAGLLVFGYPGPALAAELDCGELANRLTAGDDYQIQLELQTQKIRIELGDDYCAEPAKAWFDRHVILPAPARRDMALPAAALEAPRSEVTTIPLPDRDNEAVPLPGQKMRQGRLPDLGFDSGGQNSVPLPIQRASELPTAPPVSQQTGTEPPQDTGAIASPEQPVGTASGVRISGDAEGGAAKVTKYDTDSQNTTSPGQEPGAGGLANGKPPLTPDPGPGSKVNSKPDTNSKSEPEPPHVCDRELTDFWKPGEHMVDGQKTNLTGVFTVDLNNDGRVDNVGFKIGAKGRIGNVLGYFPVAKGRLSAQSVPTLKLEDDQDIHRLCPGDLTFKTMTPPEKVKAIGSAKRRQQELSGGATPATEAAKIEQETPVIDEEEEEATLTAEEKTENLLFWAIIIATVFFLLGGVGLFFAVRNMRSRDDDEYEDDTDEYEDGEHRK